MVWRPELRESVVTTVGQNEYPSARLRSSHKGSGEEIVDGSPVSIDELLHESLVFVGMGDESGDVLDEEEVCSDRVGEVESKAKEFSLVFLALTETSLGVGLTRDAANDEIHESTELLAREGFEIVPDRCRSQGRVLHPRHEIGCCSSLPLDTTNNSWSASKEPQSFFHSEVQSADAGADREDSVIPGT